MRFSGKRTVSINDGWGPLSQNLMDGGVLMRGGMTHGVNEAGITENE